MNRAHCQATLKSGKNKGNKCAYKAKKGKYCGKHKKKSKGASTSTPKLVYQKSIIHPGFHMINYGDIQIRSEITKIKDKLIDDLEYLKSSIRKYGEANFINKGVHFESDEPQIGKTHLILVCTWLERFYLDRRPMIILYNRLSDKNQMLGRIEKFNTDLIEIMRDLNIDSQLHEYLKLYSQPIPENATDEIWEALLTDQRGFIPIIMGNNSQMTRLNEVLDIIKTTKETPVLIVDEIHSLITNVKKSGSHFAGKFTQLVEKVKMSGGRLIGVSATGFAAYSSTLLENYVEMFIKVTECGFYTNKGLIYKSFKDMNIIETEWDNSKMMSFEKMTEEYGNDNDSELNKCLTKFDEDIMNVRKMLLVTFNVKNEDQENMGDYIEGHYRNKFNIIIFNQSSQGCIEEILDREILRNNKPIVVICRGKGTQGTTFKPGNLAQALAHDPPLLGLTHVMVCLSKEDHNEHIIQYSLRGNGWYMNNKAHPITLFINKKDHKKLKENLKAKVDLTNQLENLSYEKFYGEEPNRMREFCKMVSFHDPGNKMTRATATDLNIEHKKKYRVFGSIEIFNSYIKKEAIQPVWMTKRYNLSKKLCDFPLYDELMKRYQIGFGYKFTNSREDKKLQNNIQTYFKELMNKEIQIFNKSNTLQMSYNKDRMRKLEKFYLDRDSQYKSDYVGNVGSDDMLFVIKNKIRVFINNNWYAWERTNGEICLIKYNDICGDEFCKLK